MRKPLARLALAAAIAAVTVICVWAIELATPRLEVRVDGDYLRISVPHINFLKGKALERLKDGVSIAYIGQISITSGPNSVVSESRSVARFAMSYDIWEETISVARFGSRADMRRTISHLSPRAAEDWCLDNLTLDRSLIPADRPFYVQLDLRAEDPRDQSGIIGDPGLNITRLIQIFSNPVRTAQPHWLLNNGPFRLADLLKAGHG